MSDETTTEMLAETEAQAEQPVQIREGRWRTRGGEVRNVTPTPSVDSMADIFPWHDAAGRRHRQLWRDDGKFINGVQEHGDDLVEYLGPIEPEPEPTITPDDVAAEALAGVHDSAVVANPFQALRELKRQLETTEAALLEQQQRNEQLVTQGSQQHMQIAELQAQVRFLKDREVTLGTRLQEEKSVTAKRLQQVEELRSEVSYVQGLLGDERRRFAELETLASDLRAVNAATEKAMNSAAREKADLQHRLDTVAAEWAMQAETIRGLESLLEAVKAELVQASKDRYALQVELDAAQQVPADSPELRQLRADLAEVAHDRDTYRHAHELLLKDANTVHERTKAMTVEAIAEWLEPVRLIDSPSLANETLQHLPQIMRSLVGLDTPEDVD